MPLVLEGRVVGLLDVYDHRRRDYAEHRDFLLRVGQMMAGTFENALLMERLEDSNQTLGLLVESGIEFGATLDPDEVLQSVARRLCAATSAPNCDIFMLRGEVISCVACMDHGEPDPDHVGTEYPLEQLGLARLALDSRQPVYTEDISTDPRVSELERREDLSWGHRSMLCLPLISRGQVMGVAGIYDDQARRFERTDLLHSLAQVAAGALANATLLRRTRPKRGAHVPGQRRQLRALVVTGTRRCASLHRQDGSVPSPALRCATSTSSATERPSRASPASTKAR